MRVGIISDIHDSLEPLGAAIRFLSREAPGALLCCGDLCSPFVVDELAKYEGPVHIVFGNNDADLFRITRKCTERVQAHGEFFDMTLGGSRVAMNHFDSIARPIAQSGLYDLVCFGHNHRISVERYGSTLAVNPGPIMGVALTPGGWEKVASTFMIFDTDQRFVQAYRVALDGGVEPYNLPAVR